KLSNGPVRKRDPKLHGFWDGDAVLANLPRFPDTMPKEERQTKMDAAEKDLTTRLAKGEPKNWRLPAGTKVVDYPEGWANEILPVAGQAHARLRYQNVTPKLDRETMVADGEVVETPARDGLSYSRWSAEVVLKEMQLAGWRLADLLQTILAPPAATPTATSATPATPSA
ncbi:MAG TPA: hypothetical protein VLI42_08375, partial [Chthoniobacterales bacterium]|nr:hypothetical protein [Chthoniobacterales bacterium]